MGLTRPKQEIDASEDLPDPVVFTIPRAAVPRIRAKYAIQPLLSRIVNVVSRFLRKIMKKILSDLEIDLLERE